ARRLTGERPASRVTSRRRRRARRGRPSPYTTLFRSRAKDAAIYTEIGAAPRGHDHRARWDEMLDTCTGSTGTLESGVPVHLAELGLPTRINPFNGTEVANQVVGIRGRRHFEDSLGICMFTRRTPL